MDSNDAIEAAHAFPDAKIVAVHTDGWAHFTESGEELSRAFMTLGLGGRLETLPGGTPVTFELQLVA